MNSVHVGISARVIADSLHDRSRLTTFEVVFPRIVLAEFNTHRVLSRNSASSRAIPVWKRLTDILSFPFVPLSFGRNKAGMQSAEAVTQEDNSFARANWLVGRDIAVIQAFMLAGGEEQIMKDSGGNALAVEVCTQIRHLMKQYPDVVKVMRHLSVGVHKQHANRVLEPYSYHTVVTTATDWRNFYALRASKDAQPEIRDAAIAMIRAHMESTPRILDHSDWHLPFIKDEDRTEVGTGYEQMIQLARISSARCARVSYLTHDGVRSLDKDLSMADGLQGSGHMSPFEHPAKTPSLGQAMKWVDGGNFGHPWHQYRKMIQSEDDFSRLITRESLEAGLLGDQKMVDFVLSLAA